ncbi:MAG: hypothetical protein KF868_15295 [Acidobacteria bacterium]|nr:hypothetical protein [Acidobacteriota bacterium]
MREGALRYSLAIVILTAVMTVGSIPGGVSSFASSDSSTDQAQTPPQTPKKETKEEDPVPVTDRRAGLPVMTDVQLLPNQFGTFFSPQVNANGDVAFIGRYIDPRSPSGGQGIFIRKQDGSWSFVRDSDKIANLDEQIHGFGPFTVNNRNHSVFMAAFGSASPLQPADQNRQAPTPGIQVSQNRNGGLFIWDDKGLTNLLQFGQEVPNMPSRFSSFSNPSINSEGTIAFISAYVDPDGRGLFIREKGQLKIVARSGQRIAPGETSVFSEHYYPSRINERGEIAFLSRVGVGAGIFVARPDGIDLLALDGRPSPVRGTKFLGFGNRTPAINDKGEVAFIGFYDGPRAGRAIFLKGAGPAQTVITTRDANPKFVFTDFTNLELNNKGDIVFTARLEGIRSGIFLKTAKGVEAIAMSGDLCPGLNEGEEFNNFAQTPSINDRGQIVFYAQLKSSRVGIFVKDDKGLRPFIMRGDPLPFKTE